MSIGSLMIASSAGAADMAAYLSALLLATTCFDALQRCLILIGGDSNHDRRLNSVSGTET